MKIARNKIEELERERRRIYKTEEKNKGNKRNGKKELEELQIEKINEIK